MIFSFQITTSKYRNILFCRRNLTRAVTLLEMIKRREKTKREHVHLGIEIFEKRYQAKDFNGYLLAEYTNNAVKSSRFDHQIIIIILFSFPY